MNSRRDRAVYAEAKLVFILVVLGVFALALLTGPGCSSPAADAARYPYQGPWLDPEGCVVAPPSYERAPGACEFTAASWLPQLPTNATVGATAGICRYQDADLDGYGIYVHATTARLGPIRVTAGAVVPFDDTARTRPIVGVALRASDFWRLPAWLEAEVGAYAPASEHLKLPDSLQWQLGLLRGAW